MMVLERLSHKHNEGIQVKFLKSMDLLKNITKIIKTKIIIFVML